MEDLRLIWYKIRNLDAIHQCAVLSKSLGALSQVMIRETLCSVVTAHLE